MFVWNVEHCQSHRSNDNDVFPKEQCQGTQYAQTGRHQTTDSQIEPENGHNSPGKTTDIGAKSGNTVRSILPFFNRNKNGKSQWHKKPQIIIKLHTTVWCNQSTQQRSFTFPNHIPSWITFYKNVILPPQGKKRNCDYTKHNYCHSNITSRYTMYMYSHFWKVKVHVFLRSCKSLYPGKTTALSFPIFHVTSHELHALTTKAIVNWWSTCCSV